MPNSKWYADNRRIKLLSRGEMDRDNWRIIIIITHTWETYNFHNKLLLRPEPSIQT